MGDASHDLDAVLAQAVAWHDAGRPVGLATVVRTWGSSPRPAGSVLALDVDGAFVGSVSGGCIEAAVIAEAQAVLAGERGPGVLAFGVSDETAWEVGLACGGRIEVYVEAMDRAVIDTVRAARTARRAIALATPLDGSGPRVVVAGDVPLGAPDAELRIAAGAALRADTAHVISDGTREILIQPHNPPLRLIIVGAVHVAQPLAEMARLTGFDVTIVDPRRAWATAARFPGLHLVTDWPDAAIAALALDARAALVALTHDPKLDDPALRAALATPAFYLGCLGSTRTHAARRARLAEAGVTADALDRLHGPVGLRIGARSPAEIAVSILAEIVATLRSAS